MPGVQNLYWLVAIAAGAGLAAQAGVNTQLRSATGSALWTSLISASLTVVLLAAALLVQRDGLATSGYARYPWWIWTGGIAGAVYVLAAVVLTRPLGVATLFAAIIVGQLSAGLVIDHFGWFNVPVHRASPERLLGAILLVGGMALIRWR
jgi:bacterial/archaeal transporter family-2 protein